MVFKVQYLPLFGDHFLLNANVPGAALKRTPFGLLVVTLSVKESEDGELTIRIPIDTHRGR